MRIAKNLLLAGAAALALAGGTGLALAQPLHSMIVRLPDGGLAQIQYSGDIPPRVTFVPEAPTAEYGHRASPFAMLDQISAQIGREMDALMGDVAMGSPFVVNPERVFNVDMRNLRPGTVQYSVVSTTAGDGSFCTRSMEITRTAPGVQPHVVEHKSGDCHGVGNVPFSIAPLVPQYRVAPPIETKAWRGRHHSEPKSLNVAYQPTR